MNQLKKEKIRKVLSYILIILFFIMIDITLRYYCIKSTFFYSIYSPAPFIFDMSIIFIHIILIKMTPKKFGITYMIAISILYIIAFLIQYFHYKVLGSYFTFSELFLVGEGLDFINSIFSYINYKIMILLFIFIIMTILNTFLLLKIERKNNKKYISLMLLMAIVLQFFGYIILKIDNNGYSSDSQYSLVYNYKNYNVPYRSIQTTGFLQYPFQDIILYYKDWFQNKIKTKKYKESINEYLAKRNLKAEKNSYSEIFKNKNLIYIMLESGDDWLITKDIMPTLYKLKNEGWNFTNRYSPFFYSGYTFNSEFAANTSYYLIEGFSEYKNNYFPESLPNLFKKAGYKVNSFHMNSGDFYNRDVFHKAFGYEKYNGNYKNNTDYNYIYDVSWVRNDETYNKLINKNDKFMSFLITYSMHLPYFNNSICEQAVRNKKITYQPWEERENICLKELAYQSDLMLKELIERLEKDDLLNDTVLIIFADHNTYGYSDKEYLKEVKGTDDLNLQQKTPPIIWNNNINHQEIDTLMDTADLVPTIANLFGLEYNANYYLSTDVFSKSHDEYVFFQYGEWIDNKNNYSKYSEGKENNLNSQVRNVMLYNKLILQTDYFRK